MNGLFPNALYTLHQGKSGGRGMSPRLWSRVHGQMVSPDGFSNAFLAMDDFTNFGGIAPAASITLPSTTVPGPLGYGLYIDGTTTQGSILPINSEDGGVARLLTGATDNHETWISAQGQVGVLGGIFAAISGSQAPRLTVFEARVRMSSVADDVGAFFVGLGQAGSAVADQKVDNTGVLADRNFIGFNTVHRNGGAAGTNALLNTQYRRSGQAQQTVGSAVTITADTWYKLGFVYDPLDSERVKFYINNIQQGATLDAAAVAATLFPSNGRLTFVAGVKNGSAAAASLDIDWWAFYQDAS